MFNNNKKKKNPVKQKYEYTKTTFFSYYFNTKFRSILILNHTIVCGTLVNMEIFNFQFLLALHILRCKEITKSKWYLSVSGLVSVLLCWSE